MRKQEFVQTRYAQDSCRGGRRHRISSPAQSRWSCFENLARQQVMNVQSASDPAEKLALGERAIQADGAEPDLLLLKEQGAPVEAVYATEGTPLITAPSGTSSRARPIPMRRACSRASCSASRRSSSGRCLGSMLIPRTDEGKAGTAVAVSHQADEKRSRRDGSATRGHQSALQQDLRGVTKVVTIPSVVIVRVCGRSSNLRTSTRENQLLKSCPLGRHGENRCFHAIEAAFAINLLPDNTVILLRHAILDQVPPAGVRSRCWWACP